MSDKMREEFEAWFHDKFCHGCGKANYGSVVTLAAWEAWKASRAELCVELPEVRVLDGGRIAEIGYELAVDDFEIALDSAGVRYK